MDRRQLVQVTLLGVAVLALLLRLRDPLAHLVLPNEDPYLMLYRGSRLAEKGVWPEDYTRGFPAMLVAWQAFGLPMYDAARLVPSIWGALGVVVLFFVGRRLAGDAAGLGAALLFALMPEVVRRSNFLAPTALDLLLIPLLAWCALDVGSGRWRALPVAGVILAWLAVAHPWGLLYAAFGLAPWVLRFAAHPPLRMRWVRPMTAGALALALPAAVIMMEGPDTGVSPVEDVAAHVVSWVANPDWTYKAPKNVDLLEMLSFTPIALGVVGLCWGQRELRFLGLTWVAMLLPVATLTLTSVPYAAERTVAFLAPGLALLGGAGLAAMWYHGRPQIPNQRTTALLVLVLLLAGTSALPAATAKDWWRIYQPEEQDVYWRVATVDDAIVITGSWQASVNAGAWGADARPMPGFFRAEKVRDRVLAEAEREEKPLLVIIDRHARNKADPESNSFRNYTLEFVHIHGERLAGAGRVEVFQLLPRVGDTRQPLVELPPKGLGPPR